MFKTFVSLLYGRASYICLLHDIKFACCTIWSRCSSVNTVTSLVAGGLKNRCRITGMLRDFAPLQNAWPKGHGIHNLVFGTGQGKKLMRSKTI